MESYSVSFWAVTRLSPIGRQNIEVFQEYSSSDGGMICFSFLGINGEWQRRLENITMS